MLMGRLIYTDPLKASTSGISPGKRKFLLRSLVDRTSTLSFLEQSTIGEIVCSGPNYFGIRSRGFSDYKIPERELGLVSVTEFHEPTSGDKCIAYAKYFKILLNNTSNERPTIEEMLNAYQEYVNGIIGGLQEHPQSYQQGVPRASLLLAKEIGDKLIKRLAA